MFDWLSLGFQLFPSCVSFGQGCLACRLSCCIPLCMFSEDSVAEIFDCRWELHVSTGSIQRHFQQDVFSSVLVYGPICCFSKVSFNYRFRQQGSTSRLGAVEGQNAFRGFAINSMTRVTNTYVGRSYVISGVQLYQKSRVHIFACPNIPSNALQGVACFWVFYPSQLTA